MSESSTLKYAPARYRQGKNPLITLHFSNDTVGVRSVTTHLLNKIESFIRGTCHLGDVAGINSSNMENHMQHISA